MMVGTYRQHLACVAAQLNGVKHYRSMKPSSRDPQLGLASPLNYAANKSGKIKIKSPSKKEAGAGCKSPALASREGTGETFFLDIFFHRMSEICFTSVDKAYAKNVLGDCIHSPKEHLAFSPIGCVHFKRRKAPLLRLAEELASLLRFVRLQAVNLRHVFHGQLIRRNEHKLEDDISNPETVDVQSLDIGQNNCATFSRDRTNEKANAFVSPVLLYYFKIVGLFEEQQS
jgi:hypothetical protein